MNCILIQIVVTMVMYMQTIMAINEMYIGQKVFKVIPKTKCGVDLLNNLVDEHETNVWEESSGVDQPMVVQVKTQKLKWFKSYCESNDLEYLEMICDLKKAVDESYSQHFFGEPFNYTKFNTFQDIEKELVRLSIRYPFLMKLSVKGVSFEKRNLYLVEISENIKFNPAKKIIWIESGAHAREWISIAVGLNFLKMFLEGYGRDDTITQLLRNYTFVFVPVFNPDGYVYSWTEDRLWRKTRSINKNSTCRGVDPNRNWNVQYATVGASNDPCSLIYHGPRPESEPCVHTFAREIRRQHCRIQAYFSLHSFFQLLLIPNSYTRTFPASFTDNSQVGFSFIDAARKRFNTDYLFGPASILLGAASGVSADYLHDILNITFSYVVELRDRGQRGFLLPESEILPNSLEAFDAILASVDTIANITRSRSANETGRGVRKILSENRVTYECLEDIEENLEETDIDDDDIEIETDDEEDTHDECDDKK